MDFLRNIIASILKSILKLFTNSYGKMILGDKVNMDLVKKLEALIESFRTKVPEADLPPDVGSSKEVNLENETGIGQNENELSEQTNKVESEPPSDKKRNIKSGSKPKSEKKKYKVETLLFGTNRNHHVKGETLEFGNDNDTLRFGKCEVSIPDSHKIGKIERPFWEIRYFENVNKHIVIQKVDLLDADGFEELLCTQVAADPMDKAFLFIHGYNSTFEGAARRTAQMKSDMKFEGAAMFYSWPSAGSKDDYFKDGEMTMLSESHIKSFILTVLECTEIKKLYVIGHSMGNRPLCNVLKDIITTNPEYADVIKEIILTAPDVNAEIFMEDIVPVFNAHKKIITLYASSTDYALKLSYKFNGFRRAGESGENIIIMDGVETIDATGVDTSMADVVKHTYFAQSRSVINDIVDLVIDDKRAEHRHEIDDVIDEKGVYWAFRK